MLGRAVGVQEIAADIHDRLSVPVHGQAGFRLDFRHRAGLQVLFPGQRQERFRVFLRHDHGHPLLALGDRQLGAVQAFIFLRNRVQVDFQAVSQLADGDADAARAEVVAPLDHPGRFAVAEQPLQLPFLGGIALLDLRAAGLDAVGCMRLGGSGRAADAVPAGASAQQDHDIPGFGAFPPYVLRRSRHQLALGQLAGNGFAHGHGRIRRAGHPHRAVDICPAAQRIADRAADTGGRAAEGFNLCGMVVGLVLEQQQPGLFLSVGFHFDLHSFGSLPCAFSARTAIVATSIRQTGFVRPSALRVSR